MASAVTLLPLPLSPTSATVSPASIEKLAPSTTVTSRPGGPKATATSSSSMRGMQSSQLSG